MRCVLGVPDRLALRERVHQPQFRRFQRGEFGVGFKLALLHKDLGIVRRIAESAGTNRSVIERSLADYAELMSQGYGDDDISGLIRLKRKS